MRPSLIIPRVKAECQIFADRVAGAVTIERVMQQTALGLPHCFVVPIGDAAEGDVQISGLDQSLNDAFSIAVCVDNSADERGQSAIELAYDCRAEVIRALVGWRPPGEYGPVLYRGWEFSSDNRARAWVLFAFECEAFTLSAS